MTEQEAAFLLAASNLVSIQTGILREFELAAGMSAYDYWIKGRVGRESATRQSPKHGPWRYHFHGLEVDVVHDDGRHLRIELGPRGMTNVFTGWSVAVHVADSRSPWPVYGRLREFVAEPSGHPNFGRTTDLEQSLFGQGVFAYAEPDLVALRERYTRKTPTGQLVEIPPELRPEVTEDVFLCDRFVLTEKASARLGRADFELQLTKAP